MLQSEDPRLPQPVAGEEIAVIRLRTDESNVDYRYRVVLAVGGTAGHVHTALAIAQQLTRDGNAKCWFVGPESTRATPLVQRSGISWRSLKSLPFARQSTVGKALAIGTAARAVLGARRCLLDISPTLVVGCGGHASIPVVLAARMQGLPVVLHEANATPGLANRVLQHAATLALLGYEDARAGFAIPTLVTGNPVLEHLSAVAGVDASRRLTSPARLAVVGGSEGSPFLNERVPEVIARVRHAVPSLAVTHICGPKHRESTLLRYREMGTSADVYEYVDDMATLYREAHFVITSAGAITLAELRHFAVPALVVPHTEAAWRHQYRNARAHARSTNTPFVEREHWDPRAVAGIVSDTLRDDRCWQRARAEIISAPVTNPARAIADACRRVQESEPLARAAPPPEHASRKRATVFVLGDLGRSPRMQLHALALAAHGYAVSLVGLEGTEVMPELYRTDIDIRRLADDARGNESWSAGRAARRLGKLTELTLRTLLSDDWADLLIVQNPPSVPAIPLALLLQSLGGADCWIDWHNFGHSMLAARGASPSLAKGLERIEHYAGRSVRGHLCVSAAMQSWLQQSWSFENVHVFRDHPHQSFSSSRQKPVDELRRFLEPWLPREALRARVESSPSDRPIAWVVSSSSWGVDDVWQLVPPALRDYDDVASRDPSLPTVLLSLTGEGEQREGFERAMQRQRLRHVHWQFSWLPHDRYSDLLAASDLGICLHRSTSGLDIPMKIVDMEGAGLPWVAYDYGPVLRELGPHVTSEHLFHDAATLSTCLQNQLRGLRERGRRACDEDGALANTDWLTAWDRDVWPALQGSS